MNITLPVQRSLRASRSTASALVLLTWVLCTGAAHAWNTLTPLTNLTVCPGDSATFSTVASGPTPYRFEWWKNGVVIPGRTNNSLTLTNVTYADSATYSVKLTGGYNAVTNSATLTVRTNVSTTPLTNLVRAVGAAAVFSTTPSGTGPFTYLWKKDGATIAGATRSSLMLTNLTIPDSGTYAVVVSGACSSATRSATLMVDTCFPSLDVMLVIDRSGSMSGSPYNNARQACSNFVNNLQFTTNGDQMGLASYNSSATLNQKLTNSALVLDRAIQALPAASGNTSISLGLQTGQTELISLRHNPLALPVLVLLSDGQPTGSDTPSNALYQATIAKDAGTLIFTVGLGTNVDGALMAGIASSPTNYFFTTNASQLGNLFDRISTIICRPPTNIVVLGPTNLTVCAGSPAVFSVTASGCAAYTFQWEKNGLPITGRTNSSLVISNTTAADAGLYSVIVSSVCQTVTNSATLAVNSPTLVVTPPTDESVCPLGNVTFSVTATGTALGYQWYKGASLLAGQTGSSLTISNAQPSDAGVYSIVVGGACGAPQTNSATLTVNANILVVTPPANQTVCPGSNATFSENATGTGLGYQWYKGLSLLAGQTRSSLTLSNAQSSDAGIYSVVVGGTCGVPQTNSATLTVNANILVVTPPANQTVCPGSNATFSENATGTGLGYQWYKGLSLLAGQTRSSLTLSNAQSSDAGIYSVVVGGTCGTPQTNSATLTVNTNILVVTPPANQSVCPSFNATFSVNATGTGLGFQWYKGASLLAGQTSSILTVSNAQSSDAGIYSVVVGGTCGTPQTNSATLTVNTNILVVTPPANQSVCPSFNATFSVNATGTGLGFQWYKGASLLAGQTRSSLTLSNAQASDAGVYSVVVGGTCGTPQTNSATLTVNTNILVVTPPANQTVCPGFDATFSVNAIGTGLAYQWYKGASLLAGQTGSSLTLSNAQASDAGVYSVVVGGTCGVPQTNSATLTVNTNILVVTPPANQSVCPSFNATFSVNATGTGLGYQWYKGASLLAGQTGSSLTLSNAQSSDAGIYSVVVSGTCGTPQTNSATLTVNSNILVVTPPANQSVCPSFNATFSVNATGTGLGFQWYKGASLLAGQTRSSLTLSNAQSSDAGIYSVVVGGTCGTPQTNSATLTVNSNILVVTPPANQSVCPSFNATFSVNATGTGLGYQWYKGAGLLAGQTGSSLTLSNAQSSDAGIYSVVVGGTCGTPQTNSATLTVNSNILVVTPPANQSVCPGFDATFSVNATGTGLGYQWYKGASLLAGETGSSLTLSNAQPSEAGIYSVVVGGICGVPQTNSATLTVNSNLLVVTPPIDQTVCPGFNATFSVSATGTGLGYQWYKGASLLASQTDSSLTLSNAQSSDAGIYAVVVSGTCGTPQTNTATLTVNSNLVVVTSPADQSVCQGTIASFSVSAAGTGLSYQWFHETTLLAGQTLSSLTLTNVQPADAGVYSVLVSGLCGNAVTNSANLTVEGTTTATPLVSVTKNLGDRVTFSTVASGAGPFTYLWTKNGVTIAGATSTSLTLSNLSYADGAVYAVQVTGHCNSAVESATLTINHPPTVTIISPTNGAIFIAPANFTVVADAQDIDGTVTNVDFFVAATNRLGHATLAPYFVELTNVAAGTYTFTAKAADDYGATGVSAPVTITVLPHAPLTIISAMQFDPQTGLFEQTVRVSNPTYSTFDAVRIYVGNLTNNARLWNATGTTNGLAYVESQNGVAPGGYMDFVLEYYVPSRIQPNPTLTPVLVPPAQGGGVTVAGFQQHIDRIILLPNHNILVEFSSLTNRIYYVQYSSNMLLWKTAVPAVSGTGTKIQWIDNGPPKTDVPPSAVPSRSYRVILLP